MKSLTIAATNLRRFIRDRGNVFFVFIFPMLLILVLGSAFGSEIEPRLGVFAEGDGAFTDGLVDRLAASDAITYVDAGSSAAMVKGVERGELEAAVVIPADFDDRVARGEPVELEFLSRDAQQSRSVYGVVESVLIEQAVTLRAARFAEQEGVAGFDDAIDVATAAAGAIGPVTVTVTAAGEAFALDALGQFDATAHTQLLLFVFLTSLAGSAALIQTRRLGVARRMISTPTSVRDVLVGEGLGRFAVAMVQGLFIFFGTWLIFSVDWGHPLLAILILLVFGFVGSGAAMLMGALFSNDEQAGGMGVLLGLGLAALGGCMMPLQVFEFVSPGLYRAAHVTPHAWALQAFDAITIDDGTLVDILPFLAILVVYGLVFYAVAIWRLRVALTR